MVSSSCKLNLNLRQHDSAGLYFLWHSPKIVLVSDFVALILETVLYEVFLIELRRIIVKRGFILIEFFYAIESYLLSRLWVLDVLA
jgi:hypothetical protein